MKIRDFAKKFNLRLISASDASISLGDKVRKTAGGRIDLTHSSIIYDFLEERLIKAEEKDALLKQLNTIPLGDAGLGNIKIEVDVQNDLELKLPGIADLQTKLALDKDVNYGFKNVRAKVLRGDPRFYIEMYLDQLSVINKKGFRKKYRTIYLIERLFYANATINFSKKIELEVAGVLNESGINPSTHHATSRTVTYEFANEQVPFAMEIIKVKGVE